MLLDHSSQIFSLRVVQCTNFPSLAASSQCGSARLRIDLVLLILPSLLTLKDGFFVFFPPGYFEINGCCFSRLRMAAPTCGACHIPELTYLLGNALTWPSYTTGCLVSRANAKSIEGASNGLELKKEQVQSFGADPVAPRAPSM